MLEPPLCCIVQCTHQCQDELFTETSKLSIQAATLTGRSITARPMHACMHATAWLAGWLALQSVVICTHSSQLALIMSPDGNGWKYMRAWRPAGRAGIDHRWMRMTRWTMHACLQCSGAMHASSFGVACLYRARMHHALRGNVGTKDRVNGLELGGGGAPKEKKTCIHCVY